MKGQAFGLQVGCPWLRRGV